MMSTSHELFYPVLERRKDYKTTNGKYYSDYHEYYDEIETDCQKRCVYCDIQLEEMGGEGMQLDHFRPKSIPEFEYLKNDPTNLVLSCPKCNRLKSDHWPADITSDDTHSNGCGFIDPFNEKLNDYFEIKQSGSIKSKQAPAEYMIKLLKLNRIARIQVRRKRLLKNERQSVIDNVEHKINQIKAMVDNSDISRSKISEQLASLEDLHSIEKQLIQLL